MIEKNREINICDYVKHPFDNALLVDVREELMFEYGTLPGAVNIPLDRIRELYKLPRDRTICVFCQAGEVSREITELLLDAGYDAYHLTGGYRDYLRMQLQTDE